MKVLSNWAILFVVLLIGILVYFAGQIEPTPQLKPVPRFEKVDTYEECDIIRYVDLNGVKTLFLDCRSTPTQAPPIGL